MENTAFVIITVRDYGREEPGRHISGIAETETAALNAMYRIFDAETHAFRDYIEDCPVNDIGHFNICRYPDCTDKVCTINFTPNDPDGLFDYSARVWIEEHPVIT